VIRAYSFRLCPTPTQELGLDRVRAACCDLYNAALQQRKEAYRRRGKTLSAFAQCLELKEVCADGGPCFGIQQRPLAFTLRRLDDAYAAFFRRAKAGGTPGFPRFRAKERFNTFETDRFQVTDRRLRLLGLSIRWRPWREIPPKNALKMVRVTRKADGWYAAVVCEVEARPLPKTGRSVGLDLGLLSLVATSDGETMVIDPALKAKERRLRRWQRIVSRRKKGSNRRRKARGILARRHLELARSRKHHLDNLTLRIVRENDIVVLENLGVKALTRSGPKTAQGRGLRRSMHRASWGELLAQLDGKAEEAGRVVVRVDPRGTSQECSGCGAVVRKALAERVHRCPCGLTLDRDINAAKVILARGLRLLRGGTAVVDASRRTEKPVRVA